jgi:hypothetical protein
MSVFSFRSRLGLTVALGSLLLEGLVGCGNRAGSSSGSTLRLPDRIDGTSLSRYHDTAGHETAIYFAVTHLFPIPVGPADRKVTALYWYNKQDPVLAAIYGFSRAKAATPDEAALRSLLTPHYVTNVRPFAYSPGPLGGLLECARESLGLACVWADRGTEVAVIVEDMETPTPPSRAEELAMVLKIRVAIERWGCPPPTKTPICVAGAVEIERLVTITDMPVSALLLDRAADRQRSTWSLNESMQTHTAAPNPLLDAAWNTYPWASVHRQNRTR